MTGIALVLVSQERQPEYLCPECGRVVVSLTTYGHCPSCLFPLASKYLAIDDDGRWLVNPDNDEQRGEIIRRQFTLIYQLVWLDLKYTGVQYAEVGL